MAQMTNHVHKKSLWKTILQYKYFYIMVLPILIWYAIFSYAPMYGVTLAFKTFNYREGIFGSPWIGLEHFQTILTDMELRRAFFNTILISIVKLVTHFPTPIILAIVLYEFSRTVARRVFQTILTFPHFISWVVLSGIIVNIMSREGIFNQLIVMFGGEASALLVDENAFRPILYITHIWREIGWDSIIYLAALSGINPELYEAAEMDGANRFKRLLHISWPGLKSTVAILLILNVGQLMSQGASFDQIFNLYSSPVYSVADTIDTYIYRTSFTTGGDFGYTTAVGILKSIISVVLLVTANKIVKKLGEEGLY
ncbi:ABC transporter permease [Paenibacillus segetis]|uniref:Multiple-sugar transport system permease YteP n=1 Tax=Paenibacillus segetis TaxID=1325360 RepID=A0ABQ1YUE9_9BACL|nr:ABC transporter permease subunit [Paenibacillus segetis]GGH36485.1 putative multiple-sugar transport system permease YteP [Paenibacillus segetis]